MNSWSSEELKRIGDSEELQISSRRADGTLTKPVTIWVVRAGDGLYVRSVKGRGSGWFRATQGCDEGHISAGGVEKDVKFLEKTDIEINIKIDQAYLEKYKIYPQYVTPMVTPEVKETTIQLMCV
jgi:hypothetical protein